MTEWENLLASLPQQNPDAARAARLRAACHRALHRRHAPRRLEPAAIVGACVVYLSAVIQAALTLYGF